MEAVSPDAGLGESAWQCKGLGDDWLATVECRIKAGDLRDVRSRVKDCAYRGEIVGLVQWRQRFELCQRRQHVTIQTNGDVEFHAAMNDAMSDTFNRRSGNKIPRCGKYFPCGSVMIEPVGWPGALDQWGASGVPNREMRADTDTLDLAVEQGVGIA